MDKAPKIPLPKSWSKHEKSAMPNVISLAQYAKAYTRVGRPNFCTKVYESTGWEKFPQSADGGEAEVQPKW